MRTTPDAGPRRLDATVRTQDVMAEPTRFPRVERYREEIAQSVFEPMSSETAAFCRHLIQDAVSAALREDENAQMQMAELRSMMIIMIEARVSFEIFNQTLERLIEDQARGAASPEGEG
ncbi:hypothetical protein J2D73_10300 [Acetobacter sacchari]|uniref:DUF3135 domain-containing protein n=1 Tax=Acetobacter sacchari TaxID=2661687 RepID=A0ABS3LWA8_9PROT|nr:hypothetical protein [Acetobacter sacchari]MBO1360189.1 hypothetical protein [Acetobacter sacchari]